MRSAFLNISALLIAVAGLNMGLGLQATLLGVRAGIEGFPVLMIGIIMATYYVGYVGGSIVCPRFIANVGHIRTFAAFASMGSVAVLAHGYFVNPWMWVLFRGITGVCFAGMVMVAESWLNRNARTSVRGSVLATYMVVTLGSTALGQFLLNVSEPGGTALFVLVSAVISLSLVPVALSTTPAPPLAPIRPMGVGRLFRASPVGAVGCFTSGLLNGALWSLTSVYALGSGLGAGAISILIATIVFGGMVMQWPAGWLSDKVDRRKVLVGLLIAVTVIAVAVIVITGQFRNEVTVTAPWMLFVLTGLFGASVLPVYGVAVAHANDNLQADQFVAACSTLMLCYGTGAVVGPLVGATTMQIAGPLGLFGYFATIAVISTGFIAYRISVKAPVLDEDKEAFVAVPRTSPVVFGLDPRNEMTPHMDEPEIFPPGENGNTG